jgi:peptidoglycan hydrolase CwlO-like protein/3D (Asp-Asp-Asp) domain-containing protein
MRRAAILSVAIVLLSPGWAGAQTLDDLEEARGDRDAARGRVQQLAGQIARLSHKYQRLETKAHRAAQRLIDAYRHEMAIQSALEAARGVLEDRASAAYRAGPGAILGAYLQAITQAGTFADLHSADILIEHALESDIDQAVEVLGDRAEARSARRTVERERERLLRQEVGLATLRAVLETKLAEAEAIAEAAGLEVEELERQEQRLLRAARRDQNRQQQALVGDIDASLKQLLALLGPNGGRGCAIPPPLRMTGQSFSGLASWYGWDFAGNHTASGAIYDPRLFTAAHKTLPLNSFVRVRRGDRCAVVLVNDRGPYIAGRVIDLSMAAAQYLGVGVSTVEVDVLARA